MNDLIRVDHAALEHAMAEIDATYSKVVNDATAMEGEIRSALEGFEGAAQEAYQQSQRQWNQTKAEMDGQLKQLRNFVENSKSAMIDADAKGASMLGF